MPSLRDVEVHVTDRQGNALEEYGVQKMTKASLVSCFVESKADKPFQISVKPTMPFPGLPEQRSVNSPELPAGPGMSRGGNYYKGNARGEHTTKGGGDHYNGEAWDDDMPSKGIAEWRKNLGKKVEHREEGQSVEHRKKVPHEVTKPFHLLATMRLDGREKYEKQVIVYLDKEHKNYARYASGKVVFRSRLAYDEEGRIRESGWVFKDVGIDDLFSAMLVNGGDDDGDGAVPLTAEDDLTEAFRKMGEGKLEDKQEGKVGQIEITLEKIIVKTIKRGAWTPLRDSSKDDGRATKAALKDVSHTVGRDVKARTVTSVDAIFYEKADDSVYATFRFYYRSAETLGRFGFPGFAAGAQAPSATRKGVLAASKLASSSGVGEKARRKREEGEEEEGPVKEGRWEMSVAVRGGRGGEKSVGGGGGVEKGVEEDEEL